MSTLITTPGPQSPLRPFVHADVHAVTSYLLVGADLAFDNTLAAEQLVELEMAGVTQVLDVRLECDDEEIWSYSDVDYRWDGVDDRGQRIPYAWFDRVVSYARDAIAGGGLVLTHCHMGINRGPSAGYAVLLDQGWDPVEAIDALRSARAVAHVAYAEQALEWHHDRTGVPEVVRRDDRARLRRWRSEHPMDVVRVIAERRRAEGER